MEWNPEVYNQFKAERFAPFDDLAALITPRKDADVIDLGCGTGELTAKLADLFPDSRILGIDSSPHMLEKSVRFEHARLKFENRSIKEQLDANQKWDLIFSNAAIQWVPDHKQLLPAIIKSLKAGGQLAIQIPDQPQNITNILLEQLAAESGFASYLQGWTRTTSVLSMSEYARLLFDNGGTDIQVLEKIYPVIVKNSDAIFDWVSGTALLPYLSRLPDLQQNSFIEQYKALLQSEFPESPAFYPFKRILMVATF